MTNRTKRTTAVLAGAVALASAGYAIGSQSGDGSATAASGSEAERASTTAEKEPRLERHIRIAGPWLEDAAEELGVPEDKLRSALEEALEARRDEGRDERVEALASALGKSAGEVRAAMEKVRDARRDAFAEKLADKLGLDAAKVSAALEKARPQPPKPGTRPQRLRRPFANLAEELGVSERRLRRALRAVGPQRVDRDDLEAELAKALGVTEEQLEDAREKAHEQAAQRRERLRDELVEALAGKLGVEAGKVEEVLGDVPFPGGPWRGGPDGSDGPGRFERFHGPGGPEGPDGPGPGGPFGHGAGPR